ncbi:iron chelate uptake ABC transporter family permease subunit [Kocuria sediminis]|uniref:Iron chelate uptake ABC transporter family permease subunit n=1 Tax=Kocuria sediminis TaxID=1038857 RepID=A0A6N8GMF8_9MICC|nr:iron chelate uptake ABC transporter family permease subunit [Kocuria sediminis]
MSSTSTVSPAAPRVPGAAQRRRGLALLAALLLLAVSAAASLFWGARSVDPATVVQVLAGLPAALLDGGSQLAAGLGIDAAVVQSRVPRTLTAVLVGAALAVAGAGMQGVSRNPLGDPGLLGLTAGASCAVVLGLGWLGLVATWQLTALALTGSAVAAVLVFGSSRLGGGAPTPAGLVLSGAAVSAGFTALTSSVVLSQPAVLDRFRFWSIGSVARAESTDLTAVAPLVLLGVLLVLGGASGLNAMALGDELARGLGVDLGLQRVLVFVGVVLLSGSATALAGPIAFVGLLVPHAVRRFLGGDYRWIVLFSAVLGPALLLLADVLGRVLTPPQEIHVGITTVVLGVPVLLALLRRGRSVTL